MRRTLWVAAILSLAACHDDDSDGNAAGGGGGAVLVPGRLVAGFGTGGPVTINPAAGNDEILALVADGVFLYAAGFDAAPGNDQWRVEKRSLDTGELVQEFGAGGILQSNPSAGEDRILAMAVAAGSLYVAGHDNAFGNPQWRIEKRSASTGTLDPAFGAGGVVTSNPTAGVDNVRGLSVDSTWAYVVGFDSTGGAQLRIEKRSLADGTLDPGFGAGGVVTSNPSAFSDAFSDVAVDDSFLYAVGEDGTGASLGWRIEKRSKTTGALDPGFGAGGVIQGDYSGVQDVAQTVLIDGSFLYVGGLDQTPGNVQLRLEKRSMATGALDPAFGAGGVVTENPSAGDDRVRDLALASGSLFVVGEQNNQWSVEKRSATTGALDPSFGVGGIVGADYSLGNDASRQVLAASDGIFVGGWDAVPGNEQWRIEKRDLAAGASAAKFGTGFTVSNPSGNVDTGVNLAVDASFVYAAGYDFAPGNEQWRIEKRNRTTGALDAAFGTGGVVQSNPSAGWDQPWDIAIDATFLYVVGHDSAPGSQQLRIEKRTLATGALDPAFGAAGVLTLDPSPGVRDYYSAVVIDATSMYLAAPEADDAADPRWRIEKRSLATGALDPAFGTAGVISINPTAGADRPFGIVSDGASLYVAGESNGGFRIEKRSMTDGALDAAFGTAGVVSTDPSASSDRPYGIAVVGGVFYLAGAEGTGGDQYRIEKRFSSTGALDVSFGTGGVVTSNPGGGSDILWAVEADADALYVFGQDSSLGSLQWHLEKRSAATGALDPAFGAGGVILANRGITGFPRMGAVLSGSDLFVTGRDVEPGNAQFRVEKRNK